MDHDEHIPGGDGSSLARVQLMRSQRRARTGHSTAWIAIGGALALAGLASSPEVAARFVFPVVTVLLACVAVLAAVAQFVWPSRVVRRLAASVAAVSTPWYAFAGLAELVNGPVPGSSPSIIFVIWAWTVAGLLATSFAGSK